jgi:hypothetical protein
MEAFSSQVADKVAARAQEDRDAAAKLVSQAGTLLKRTVATCKAVAEAAAVCGFEVEEGLVVCRSFPRIDPL